MARDQPSATQRRSRREIKKSQRAQDADEPIPGIDSPSNNFTSSARSHAAGLHASISSQKSPCSRERSRVTTSISNPRNVGVVEDTAQSATNYTTMTPRRGVAQYPVSCTKKFNKAKNKEPDYLSSLSLPIYNWPYPRPKDFTNLSTRHKAWKSQQDAHEAANDADPELDDWHEKCGRAEAYQTSFTDSTLDYSIARSFILRAKRAFRNDVSWEEFEDAELAIDSTAKARAVEHPARRALEMSESVDNKLRLAIFEEIRHRLCAEVWLRWYPHERLETEVQMKKDSIDPMSLQDVARRLGTTDSATSREIGGRGLIDSSDLTRKTATLAMSRWQKKAAWRIGTEQWKESLRGLDFSTSEED